MIEVKISSRGSGKDINLQQYVGNDDNVWGDYRFHVNSAVERADVWFVVEDLDDDDTECVVPPENIIFLSAETSWPPGFYDENPGRSAFLDQFAHIYTCHDIYRPNVTAAIPFLPWMINANHGPSINARHPRDITALRAMEPPEKTKLLSVFCSNQTMTAEHRMRLRFVEQLKEHFGDRLDWFGNGINPLPEKWPGIAPYRYTIVLENHAAPNVLTEKIMDAYLGFAYPIYWGAPNLSDYIPANAFTPINIADLNGSIAITEELIASTTAEDQLSALVEARNRVLGPLHLYERMSRVANHAMDAPSSARSTVTLRPMGECVRQPALSIQARAGHLLERLGGSVRRIGSSNIS